MSASLWIQDVRTLFMARFTHTTLCDKVGLWVETGRWVSKGKLVSSINKTDRHDITEILLKVALNTITLNLIVLIGFFIMKRILKQWWQEIPPISTKRTIVYNLESLNIEKGAIYDVGNPSHGLRQAQKCGEVMLRQYTFLVGKYVYLYEL